MSMKKALDQTLRDIKRGVNKKVLKVPSVEQNVLDATSNEPWGPHGSLLSDIAQATRNYHEYQMIMAILWKRINDTGKNWRHVYKALTVLDYLVAHGSERVIDDIKEHAYQISTLSDFQYIDSSGRDQGNNVRRKSQSLVALVNDKERIQEVRQKAATNRDKFRSSSAVGGMYRPGSGGYGDDRYEGRYGGRDDDRNGNGRERDWGYEGDRYGRDSEDNYVRDSYRDDDSRGRSVDEYQYGSRGRSADRDGDRAYDEDERHSSRGSSVKADDQHDGKRLERKFSEQNLGAPPSYEDAVGVSRSPTYSERDGETPPATAAQLSPPATAAQLSPPAVGASAESSPPIANAAHSSAITDATPQPSPAQNNVIPSQDSNVQADSFDEFDPRGSVSAAPSTSHNAEMDLLGSLSDAFAPGPLAIMPAPSGPADFEVDTMKPASNPTQSAVTSQNTVLNQSFDDPFGDSPFKAIPSDDLAQPHNFTPTTSFQPAVPTLEHTESGASNLEFPNTFPGLTYNQANAPNTQSPPNQFIPGEQQSFQENDILAGILPPSGPYGTTTQVSFPASTGQPPAGLGFIPQSAPPATSFHQMAAQNLPGQSDQLTRHNSLPFSALPSNSSSNMTSHQSDDLLGGFLPQAGASHLTTSHSTGSLALVPHQPAEKKFETKSTVWADTLNRGLVNLNISGSKINPLSDIGIDFESLNRKEKRMEKPSATPATSTVSMGKAMGSGSGIGRAGAGALRPGPNQMMGPTMGGMGMGGGPAVGMGMGGGPGVGMGMGNYGSVNQQPMGMGMGMGGMGMGMNMGMGGTPMGMNMGMGQGVSMQQSMGQGVPMQPSMGQGVPMQQPHGLPPGSNVNNYPMMGRGGYPPQQTYQHGGGYR